MKDTTQAKRKHSGMNGEAPEAPVDIHAGESRAVLDILADRSALAKHNKIQFR